MRRGASGSVIVEWAIALPVVLLVTFGVMQFALAMTAKIIVNHAAFCAARAALVVPRTDSRDGRSWEERAGQKALEAAAILCAPLGGVVSDGTAAGGTASPSQMPGWGTQLRSAAAREKVFISDPAANQSGAGPSPGTPRLTLTSGERRVRCDVSFDYELIFPFVDFLFAGGDPLGSADPTQDRLFSTSGAEHAGWRHMRLTETCTLAMPWDWN
ncbi:MAG: pilus assembly protein [Planctomycetes bacterium]|nr:pilus assembly protein [Planctomycetota bacterium]